MLLEVPEPAASFGERLRSEFRPLLLLYVVALLLRVAAGLTVSPVKFTTEFENDEPEYRQIANSLVESGEYRMVVQQSPDHRLTPTAFRLPIPSLSFALGRKFLGDTPAAYRCLSVIVSSLSAPLLFLFALKVTTRKGAWISAIVGLAWPSWVVYSITVLSEPFFVPAFLLGLILSAEAIDQAKPRAYGRAGVAWGIASMIRPHGLPMVVLLALLLAYRGRYRTILPLVLGFAMVVAPWAIRNRISLGTFTFLETVGGETFLGSNNPYVADNDQPQNQGMWIAPLEIAEYREHLRHFPDELDRNREQYRMAFAYLKDHLSAIPRLTVYKLKRWLTPVTESTGKTRWAVMFSYVPLVVCVALGFLTRRIRWDSSLIVVLLWTLVLFVLCVVMWGLLTRGRLLLELAWIPWGVESVRTMMAHRRSTTAERVDARTSVTASAN